MGKSQHVIMSDDSDEVKNVPLLSEKEENNIEQIIKDVIEECVKA